MRAVCVTTADYRGFAAAMVASLREQHPGAPVTVLDLEPDVGELVAGVETVTLADLEVAPQELARRATAASVGWFAMGLKPVLLRHVLRRDGGPVVWLDADCLVLAPLDPLLDALAQRPVALTPQLHAPARRWLELETERNGTCNAGVVAVDRGADGFLDWWEERVRMRTVFGVDDGYFGDQAWLGPALHRPDVGLCRDRGVNVAWIDLTGAELAADGHGGYVVDGVPLRVFHLAGPKDPGHPVLGGVSAQLALRASRHPAYGALLRDAKARIGDAPRPAARGPWDTTPGGVPLDETMRRVFRERWIATEAAGEPPPPDAFTAEETFFAWLAEPVDRRRGAAGLTRYLDELRRDRPEVQAAHPEFVDAGLDGYVAWARAHLDVPAALLGAPAPSEGAPDGPYELVAGVTLVDGATPAGAWAPEALAAAGVPRHVVGWSPAGRRAIGLDAAAGAVHDVNVVAVEPAQLPMFDYDLGSTFRLWRYTIALWGRDPDPDTGPALTRVDEVWSTRRDLAAQLAAWTFKPVVWVGAPVSPATPADRVALGSGGGPVLTTALRTPADLAAAIAMTAAPREAGLAELVVVACVPETGIALAEHAWSLAQSGRHPGLGVVEAADAAAAAGLLAAADAVLAPAAREDPALAGAVAAGVPAIADPAALGPDDVGLLAFPIDAEDPGAAVRAALADPEGARRRGALAGAELRAARSPQAVGQRMADRLAELGTAGRIPVGPRGERPEP